MLKMFNLIGLDTTQVEEMQELINQYIQDVNKVLDETEELKKEAAYKGEYSLQIGSYVLGVKIACQAVTGYLKIFNNRLSLAKSAFELQDASLRDVIEEKISSIGGDEKGDKTGDNKSKSSKGKGGVTYGEYDMENYPVEHNMEDGKKRAVLVANYLVENGNFTKEQAAAMAGVFLDENYCDPGEIMKAEYRKNKNSYGAGIGSWTYQSYKNQCLQDAGLPKNTPIETLTMQQQCDMLIANSQKSSSTYYNALRRCNNIEDASATAVVITGGVGFSNNWSTHPTAADAKKLADTYGRNNDAKYGKSSYHWNLDQRRLQYAKEILAEMD